MCNIIIFSNNLKFIKKYTNAFEYFDNAKIIAIISTKSELEKHCSKFHIDLIILNSNSFNKKSIKPLLDTIDKKMVVHDNPYSCKSNSNIIHISHLLNEIQLSNILNRFINSSLENNIRKNTRKLLKKLDFDFKLKGTNYLLEAIVYSYLNKNEYLYDNLEKNIYTYISKQYGVSTSIIKHSIIRAINNTNSNCLKSIFKNIDKITTKTFITEIVNHI